MSLSAYAQMKEGLHHEMLSKNQERSLLLKAKAGDQAAIADLIKFNERLIHKIVLYYYQRRTCGDCEIVDLQQYGRMGVMKAIERFDMNMSNRFSTYATYWIRAYIRRYGTLDGNRLSMSYDATDWKLRINLVAIRLCDEIGRFPSDIEISKKAGIPLSKVRTYREVPIVSFSAYARSGKNPDTETEIGDIVPDKAEGPQEQAETAALFSRVDKELDNLPRCWKNVIIRRYGLRGHEPQTQRKVAADLKLTQQRILQIETAALDKLRESLGSAYA
jgi:RNA polymerase sigma factor (sigma-70 family)